MESLQQNGVLGPATHAVHMLSYYRDKYQLSLSSLAAQAANDCNICCPLPWHAR